MVRNVWSGVHWGVVERYAVNQGVKLVSWCSEPSQPHRITSGLETNSTLSPSYSFRKSLYHKSLFLKPQLKVYSPFRSANQKTKTKKKRFGAYFIFRGHLTPATASIAYNEEQGDLSNSA